MPEKQLRDILSKNIKRFRKRYLWAQMDLAAKANISVNFLSDIETGKKWPYPGTLMNIATALNVEVHELFMKEDVLAAGTASKISKYTEDATTIISQSLKNLCASYLLEE
jgi:transcriptional regulator with XRE-family HTH domain